MIKKEIILKIIDTIDIPNNTKEILIENIDFLNKNELFSVIKKYLDKLEQSNKKNDAILTNFNKKLINFNIKKSELSENEDFEKLLKDQLNNL